MQLCEQYAMSHNFRNLDHLLEAMVFEGPFAALIIIDELGSDLENVLVRKFQFGVEVLELARYENDQGERAYLFEPFLADLSADAGPTETLDIDTVVVPARPEGFQETFLNEHRWYAIRVHGTMHPQIKYIATYQVAPIYPSIYGPNPTRTLVANFLSAPVPATAPCKAAKGE